MRNAIELGIATHIDPNVWLDLGERAINTAWQVLERAHAKSKGEHEDEAPQGMSATRAPRQRQMSG